MRLWPDDYEPLRAEMRAASAAASAQMNRPQNPDLSVAARVAQQRAIMTALTDARDDAIEREIAGVRCRLFVPDGPPRGVYLHFHGGGMILGHPSMNDADNHHLMRRHDLAVVSVDYRLAPEHPYPAGPDDGQAVAAWLLEHAETELGSGRLVTGGESAGGYMAAATLLRVRDHLGAIDRFLGANLVFGVFDWGRSPSQRGIRPSAGADVLSPEAIAFFTDCFLPGRTDDDRRDPAVSPAFADLTRMPPALMTVGTADHLLDDTLMLASRWAAFERPVDLHVLPDAPHGFFMFGTEMSRRHQQRLDAWFTQILGPAPPA